MSPSLKGENENRLHAYCLAASLLMRGRDSTPRVGSQSIPTLLIFREGALVRQFTGVTPPEELLAAIGGA